MNQEFLTTLEKKTPNYEAIFKKLYQGVIETNKLIGIGLDDITEEQREALIETYFKLRIEEGKEVEEAIEKEDRVNLVNELIDILVVAGYEWYLSEDEVFDTKIYGGFSLEDNLLDVIANAPKLYNVAVVLLATQEAIALMGCNVDKAVDEVLKANLSKFPTFIELRNTIPYICYHELTVEDCIDWQCQELEKGGRYSGVTCEKVIDSKGEERFVFWSEKEYGQHKRKYLKPITFKKAELDGCWK